MILMNRMMSILLFFFNDTATTEIYTLSLHDALPISIWIGDYVLSTYGTGAVMAVPAHDERDFAFANKYNLPIETVIEGGESLPYTESGKLINSAEFTGMNSEKAKEAIKIGRAHV